MKNKNKYKKYCVGETKFVGGTDLPYDDFVLFAEPVSDESDLEDTGYILDVDELEFIDMPYEDDTVDDNSLYELEEDRVLRKLRKAHYYFRRKDITDYYVADGIGDDYKNWTNNTPIFVSGQTGSGKNYFIEYKLISDVKESNYRENVYKKIIIFSNRIALNKQVKRRIESNGIVKVLSYQSFLEFSEHHKNLKSYKYVIFDECHFFTSDAMFNPKTGIILREIIIRFRHAVRIYMSSTFNDCIKYIFDCENSIHNPPRPTYENNQIIQHDALGFVYYKFKRDYSYFDIKYYSEHPELFDNIATSVEKGEKWLIFIDNKKKCQDFKIDLLEHCTGKLKKEDILLIDAGSKGDTEYEEMLDVERYKQKILISTSVIDNGVNIKDPKLKNVVVSAINKDKVLQMIGRKRVEGDERVNLYLKKFDKKYIEKRISDLERQKDAYRLYNLAYKNYYDTKNSPSDISNARKRFNETYIYGDISDIEDAKHWFYPDNRILGFGLTPDTTRTPVLPNDIAVSLVDKVLLPRYNYILDRMKETGDGKEFLEQQLSWFGKTYSPENDISLQCADSSKEEFDEYVEGLRGKTISTGEQLAFRREFKQKYNKAYGDRPQDGTDKSRDNYGKKIINDILSGINKNLVIETHGTNWEVTTKR